MSCGKCLNCKKNKVNQWSFRLVNELKVSDTAYFVTLTYDTKYVPLTKRGFMTLKKKIDKLERIEGETKKDYRKRCQKRLEKDVSLQGFFKRLRYYEKTTEVLSRECFEILQKGGKIQGKGIKYYGCGEYGTKRFRPHYHIIIFNVYDTKSIQKAWQFGGIHVDEVNSNTIEYTLKYINKPESIKRKGFDGENEFSLKSKGLGNNFLTKNMIRYHKENLEVNNVWSDKGYKVPMPKVYRDKMLDQKEKDKQIGIIKEAVEKEEEKTTDAMRIMAVKVRDKQLKRNVNRDID